MTPVLVVIPDPLWFPPFGVRLEHEIAKMESMRDLGVLCWVDESAGAPPPPTLRDRVEFLLFGCIDWFSRPPYPALRAGSWSVST